MTFDVRRWLREPLLHFMVLGALLFLLFHFVNKSNARNQDKIVVTSGQIRTMSESFQRVWRRPPNQKELDSLIQDYIKEEIYYREALALGLDKEDTIIRRRLRQKIEFVADAMGYIREPTDQDLQSYLQNHPEKFRIETHYTFSHVYLNPENNHNASELLAKLNSAGESVDPDKFGDSFIRGYYFSNQSESNIARIFGEQFAKKLSQFPIGKWAGPVESGFGAHLVLITNRMEGKLPVLADVRKQVQSEWMNEEQEQTSQKFYENLRRRYKIKIEPPLR